MKKRRKMSKNRVCFRMWWCCAPEGRIADKNNKGVQAHLTNEGRVEGRVAVEGKALGLVLAGCAVEVGEHTRLLTPG